MHLSPTDQLGESGVVRHLPLQQRQVRPQERHHKRPQRVVGRLLECVVELFDGDCAVLGVGDVVRVRVGWWASAGLLRGRGKWWALIAYLRVTIVK